MDYLTLADVRKRIPGARGNKAVSPSTITRWVLLGARAIDGAVIKLNAIRAGNRWLFVQEDLDAFFNRLACKEVQQGRTGGPSEAAKQLELMGA